MLRCDQVLSLIELNEFPCLSIGFNKAALMMTVAPQKLIGCIGGFNYILVTAAFAGYRLPSEIGWSLAAGGSQC